MDQKNKKVGLNTSEIESELYSILITIPNLNDKYREGAINEVFFQKSLKNAMNSLLSIKIFLKQIFFLYLCYFLSLGISFILEELILGEIYNLVFKIPIIKDLNLFSLAIFIFLFIIFLLIFKIIKPEDIIFISNIFKKDKRTHNIIQKILKVFINN